MPRFGRILFCGLVFRGDDLIDPLKPLNYILPLKWLFNAAGWDIFTPAVYAGAEECTLAANPLCIQTDNGAKPGYWCPNATGLNCFGRTGAQVLETLHYSYDTLKSEDQRAMDVGLILAFAVTLKLCYSVALVRMNRTAGVLKAADPELSRKMDLDAVKQEV